MAGTRRYDFTQGFGTSVSPTPADPSNDGDIISLGYADTTYAHRDSWFDSQVDNDAIRAIPADERFEDMIVFNGGNSSFYKFDPGSVAVDDDDMTLEPDAGTGRFLRVTDSASGGSGNSIVQEFSSQVSTFNAGEAITDRDAVCAELHNGSGTNEYKLFRCDTDLVNRGSFVGIATSAATVTPNIKTYTISAAYVSGNVIPFVINGRSYSTTYATTSDASLQAVATAMATDQDVASAVVTVVGGNQTGTDDRVITITSRGGLQLNITGTTVTSGASQPTVSIAQTQAAVQNSLTVIQLGPVDGFSGLTPGMAYYLSGTTGGITETPSTMMVYVGRAMDATNLFVDPKGIFTGQWGSAQTFIRAAGSSTGDTSGPVQTVEHYNLASWAAGTNTGTANSLVSRAGDTGYVGFKYILDGVNSSNVVSALFKKYDKSTWSAVTNKATSRSEGSTSNFNGFLTASSGSTTAAQAGSVNTYDKFNNASWGSGTGWANIEWKFSTFVYSNTLRQVGGQAFPTAHLVKNTSDANNTDTAQPVSSRCWGTNSPGSKGIAMASASDTTSGTGGYEWAGSWSAITANYAQQPWIGAQCAFISSANLVFTNGGQTANTSGTLTSSQTYNGNTFSSATASSNAISGGSAGVI